MLFNTFLFSIVTCLALNVSATDTQESFFKLPSDMKSNFFNGLLRAVFPTYTETSVGQQILSRIIPSTSSVTVKSSSESSSIVSDSPKLASKNQNINSKTSKLISLAQITDSDSHNESFKGTHVDRNLVKNLSLDLHLSPERDALVADLEKQQANDEAELNRLNEIMGAREKIAASLAKRKKELNYLKKVNKSSSTENRNSKTEEVNQSESPEAHSSQIKAKNIKPVTTQTVNSSTAMPKSQTQSQQQQQQLQSQTVMFPAMEADADDPDIAFHEYMQTEDGEDELNDPEYQESARALAKSTGWSQNEIEGKANDAVKSLTSAIGGKKVVNALKGMLNGLDASHKAQGLF